MKLSLRETAAVLGKSERQVRYLIRQGQLPARKDAGRWSVDSSDLPLSETQRNSLAGRLGQAREAVERGLEPISKAAEVEKKRAYSVRNLDAFTIGLEIYRSAQDQLGPEAVPCRHLLEALSLISRGCHSFHPLDKAKRFTEARDEAARAVVAVLLLAPDADEPESHLPEQIEQKLIPRLSGLVALHEKRSRRSRFDQFGGLGSRAQSNR